MRFRRSQAVVLLLGLTFGVPRIVRADEAETFIEQANARRQLGNTVQTLTLVMTAKSGSTKEYVLETRTRSVDGLEQSLAIIQSPEGLKGVQFLRKQKAGAEDDKWMYMPAGDTLNHIAGSGRTGSFLGTDFTYEDMELGDVGSGSHRVLAAETIQVGGSDLDCHRIETTPKAGIETAYGKLVTWIQKDTMVPRRILMYAPDGTTESKRLTFEAVAADSDRFVATRMRMENLRKGSSTLLEVTDHRLDVPASELPDAMFDPEQLSGNL